MERPPVPTDISKTEIWHKQLQMNNKTHSGKLTIEFYLIMKKNEIMPHALI